jgi:Ca2+-binding EF-hand superfamily protein
MGNKAGGKGKKDPTVLTDEDVRILKLNTQYSEEEIQAWHSGFLKDCPSGKLDKKQFLNVYKVCFFFIKKNISYSILLY